MWDFCRAVDDAVDEAPDETNARTRLSLWRDELAACYAPDGIAAHAARARAASRAFREFDLPRRPFEDLIDGVEMDLAHVRYQTFAQLADYCRRVASAVGLVCVEIFGYRDSAARAYAVDLGMALQLTNIIRDVAADLRNGRVYLPAEDLARFRVTEDDLRAGRLTPAVSGLMRFECERARFYYTKAAADAAAGRTAGACLPPRSWARSTSRSCAASSDPAMTSSAGGFACRVRIAR